MDCSCKYIEDAEEPTSAAAEATARRSLHGWLLSASDKWRREKGEAWKDDIAFSLPDLPEAIDQSLHNSGIGDQIKATIQLHLIDAAAHMASLLAHRLAAQIDHGDIHVSEAYEAACMLTHVGPYLVLGALPGEIDEKLESLRKQALPSAVVTDGNRQ